MREGCRIAIDVGKARIGVAVSDKHGILASPHLALKRSADSAVNFSEISAIIDEFGCIEGYVGLPLNLKGEDTESTRDAVDFGIGLQNVLNIPLMFIDERMTTKIASIALNSSGKNSRQQRGVIDSAAAAVILESALELERRGMTVGRAVNEY